MTAVTHFDAPDDQRTLRRTLCGRSWDTVVANDRPATCVTCSDEHARRTGWAFPLPTVVI